MPRGAGARSDRPSPARRLETYDEVASSNLHLEGHPDLTRYQVMAGTIYRGQRHRSPAKHWLRASEEEFERMLGRLLALVPREVQVPDLDFVVNLGDYPVPGAPIFSRWGRPGDHNMLIPAELLWEFDPTVSLEDPAVRSDRPFDPAALTRPWRDRASKLYWRGTATGMYDSTFRRTRLRVLARLPIGRGLTRLDLCRLSAKHPDLIDAAITDWQQVSEEMAAILRARYRHEPRVPRSRFLGYRYIINVDGNVATSSFLTFLGSGSAVVRQSTPFNDWCSHRLLAGEHYIPIARDLSDLVATARRCQADPEMGHAISEAGRRFAERYLTGRSVDFFILSLLACYAPISPPVSMLKGQVVRVS